MMGKREEKQKDLKDSIIPLPTVSEGPQVVDLRKNRPKEENWSYLIGFLLAISIPLILLLIALLS